MKRAVEGVVAPLRCRVGKGAKVVPTIYQRSHFSMVGTLRFANSTTTNWHM